MRLHLIVWTSWISYKHYQGFKVCWLHQTHRVIWLNAGAKLKRLETHFSRWLPGFIPSPKSDSCLTPTMPGNQSEWELLDESSGLDGRGTIWVLADEIRRIESLCPLLKDTRVDDESQWVFLLIFVVGSTPLPVLLPSRWWWFNGWRSRLLSSTLIIYTSGCQTTRV